MKIIPQKNILRKSATIVIFLVGVVEISLAIIIHKMFRQPVTDVLGSSLLKVHGSRALEIQLFVASQFIVIPAFLWLLNDIYGFNVYGNYEWKSDRSRQKNVDADQLLPFVLSGFTLLMALGTFIFSRITYFSSHQTIVFVMIPTMILLTSIIMKILFPRLKSTKDFSKLHRSNSYIIIFLFGCAYYEKYKLYESHISINFTRFALAIFVLFGFSEILTRASRISDKIAMRYIQDIIINIPIFCFLLYSRTVGNVNLNAYESFSFSNVKLFRLGELPWKNFPVEHGVWEDLFRPVLGGMVGNTSDWGIAAGISSFIRPLEYAVLGIAIYILSKRLIVSYALLIINYCFEQFIGQSALGLPRMLPLIPLTVCIYFYLKKPTRYKIIGLAFFSSVSLLWSQEGIYSAVSLLFMLITIRIFGKNVKMREEKHLEIFVSSGLLLLVGTLSSAQLLINYVRSFISDSDGYLLAWGDSIHFDLGLIFCLFFVLIPIVSIGILSLGLLEIHLLKVVSETKYLWLFPLSVSCFAYYVKFLQWPDWHLGQSASLLILGVLLFWAVSKLKVGHQLTTLEFSLIVTVLISVVNISVTSPIINQSSVESTNIGPTDDGTTKYVFRVKQVQKSFSKYIDSENKYIFDFGNEPVTWYDILGYQSVGSSNKVLNLYSKTSQNRVVEELQKASTEAAIWGGEFGYWGWPFNGNWMKQYQISSYLLNNFVPVASDGQYVLMKLRKNSIIDFKAKQQVMSVNCDWMNGVGHFIPPETLKPGASAISIQSPGSVKVLNSQRTFKLPLDARTKGIFVKSKIPVEVFLKSDLSDSTIHFNLTDSRVALPVWLDQCPVFHYSSVATRWTLSTTPSDAALEIHVAEGETLSTR
jgi:hypothetical protein